MDTYQCFDKYNSRILMIKVDIQFRSYSMQTYLVYSTQRGKSTLRIRKETLQKSYLAEPCPYDVINEVVIPPNDKGQIKSFFHHRRSEAVRVRPCQQSRTLFNTGSVLLLSLSFKRVYRYQDKIKRLFKKYIVIIDTSLLVISGKIQPP